MAPPSSIETSSEDLEYVGFWPRVLASLIDTVVMLIVVTPLLVAVYGWTYFSMTHTDLVAGPADFLISYVLPAAGVIAFWHLRQATPGKMAIHARVVDARTGNALSIGQSILRYCGYIVATIPFGLGLLWVGFDAKKQGWHDKLAGTVVVRDKHHGPQAVRFDDA